MRSLFTIHAGEYLVGLYIQQKLKLNVWIPAKDTGIDLLVSDRKNRSSISLQVKYGKDFVPGKSANLRKSLRCLSWFTLNRSKLSKSEAEFWVFVLHGFNSDRPDFVVIPTPKLKEYMEGIRSKDGKQQIYLCSTKTRCWETRDLRNEVMLLIAKGTYEHRLRDFTKYLNKNGWNALKLRLKH